MIDLNKILTLDHRLNIAVAYSNANDRRLAIQVLESALDLAPNDLRVLCNLATLHHAEGAIVSAREYVRRALALDPECATAWEAKAKIFQSMGNYEAAIGMFKDSLRITPSANVYNNLAMAQRLIGDTEGSMDSYNRAVAMDQGNLELRFYRSMDMLLGAFTQVNATGKVSGTLAADALGEYELRFAHSKPICPLPANGKPFWAGMTGCDDLNRRVLICAEQGLGDCVMMLRFAVQMDYHGATVMFIAPTHWHPIIKMAKSVDGGRVFDDDRIFAPDAKLPDYDCHISMMSLMRAAAFDTIIPEHTPYLAPMKFDQDVFSGETFFPKDKFKVGLCWQGSRAHGNDANRSIGLDRFMMEISALRGDDTEFYSLQQADETQWAPGWVNRCAIEDTGRLAHAINAMDLIITVDSAPLHIAGALGKDTIGLLASNPDWRYGATGSKTHLYETVKLVRATRPKEWREPLAEATMIASKCRAFHREGRSQ